MSRKNDLERLISQYNRRRQKLKEKEAQYGLEVPVSVLTEIEDLDDKIEVLQTALEQGVEDQIELLQDGASLQKPQSEINPADRETLVSTTDSIDKGYVNFEPNASRNVVVTGNNNEVKVDNPQADEIQLNSARITQSVWVRWIFILVGVMGGGVLLIIFLAVVIYILLY